MTHFSKLTALFAISAAASISATGCYAQTEDPTEENDVASVDEGAADEALAVTDAEANPGEEATGEDESALSSWGYGRYPYGGFYRRHHFRGYPRFYGGYPRFYGGYYPRFYGGYYPYYGRRYYGGGYCGWGGYCGYGGYGGYGGYYGGAWRW